MILGVDDSGKKHLVALADGVRESAQAWKEVLLDLRSRRMKAPALAVGDGALSSWICALGGLWHHRPPEVLVPQERQRHQLRAQIGTVQGAQRPVRDLDGPLAGRGGKSDRALSGEVRGGACQPLRDRKFV